MSGYAQAHNIGGYLSTRFGAISSTVDSSVDGDTFDRQGATSAVFAVAYSATDLASAEDLTITVQPQHGSESDGSDASNYDRSGNISSKTVATGGSPTGVEFFEVRLDDAEQYVRGQVTVGTSSSTSAVNWTLLYVIGGHDTRPPTTQNDISV